MAKFPRVGIAGEDGVVGGLIYSFTSVVYLPGHQAISGAPTCLVQFHGFSPVLKSMRLNPTPIPSLQSFNFIHWFPPLDDL